MLLVWFKREFGWADVLRLWEALWTDRYSSNFHLFIALAILEKHRTVIMDHLKHFDEVLKYGEQTHFSFQSNPQLTIPVNELSNTIDLQSTLLRAEALFRRFQRTVEAIDKKHNFPAPLVRQRKPDASNSTTGTANSAASGAETQPSRSAGNADVGSPAGAIPKEKIITLELRNLLSREVEKFNKPQVAIHGGGLGS